MGTVFDLLKSIEQRPNVYLGGTDADRGVQLRRLEMLLLGYSHALNQHGIEEPGLGLLHELGAYLRKHSGWSMASGVIEAVLRESSDTHHAWQVFWKAVWEFRDQLEE